MEGRDVRVESRCKEGKQICYTTRTNKWWRRKLFGNGELNVGKINRADG